MILVIKQNGSLLGVKERRMHDQKNLLVMSSLHADEYANSNRTKVATFIRKTGSQDGADSS